MISFILAKDKNNGIGANNDLLCRISDDLKRFKALTLNHTIVMGYNTFKSLPALLPKRKHVILTNNHYDNLKKFGNDVQVLNNENEVNLFMKNAVETSEEIFVIGGGQIFRKYMHIAQKLYVTEILDEFIADVFFVEIGDEFEIIDVSEVFVDEKSNISYVFKEYIRKNNL